MFTARSLEEYIGQFRGDDSLYHGRRVLVNAPEIYGNGREGVILGSVGSNGWSVSFGFNSYGTHDYWAYHEDKLIPL